MGCGYHRLVSLVWSEDALAETGISLSIGLVDCQAHSLLGKVGHFGLALIISGRLTVWTGKQIGGAEVQLQQ